MPDDTQPKPEPTPYQVWAAKMEKDNVILKQSGRIMECVRKIEELDDSFDTKRKEILDIVADVERWHHRLDQAIEEWKIRKQDLFVQHFTTPLMDRGNKALATYLRTRRYRSVSLRSMDPARTKAQELMERMEREAADYAERNNPPSPQPENETQETSTPEAPAATGQE